MSGEGRAAEANVSAAGVRVAIVAASWHETVMDGLLATLTDFYRDRLGVRHRPQIALA